MQFTSQQRDLEGNIQEDMRLHELLSLENKGEDHGNPFFEDQSQDNDISNLFEERIPDHKEALTILQEALPIARSKYLFEDSAPFRPGDEERPRYDGVIRTTADSLQRSERHLGREIREESPVLRYHFANLGLKDQYVPETEEIRTTYEKVNTLYETLAPTDQSDIETPSANQHADVLSSLERMSLGNTYEPVSRNEMFENLPFEGKLYAKAIELGTSDKSYAEAKKEFEAFYLSEVMDISIQGANSYGDFLEQTCRLSGYNSGYLPDKSREYLGCTPYQCWQQYLQ